MLKVASSILARCITDWWKNLLLTPHEADLKNVHVDASWSVKSLASVRFASAATSAMLKLNDSKGFEPLRAEPNGFLVHHLNHSVTLSLVSIRKRRMTGREQSTRTVIKSNV
jgi:hypothetical protein